MTHFLEALTGDVVVADVIDRHVGRTGTDDALGVPPGEVVVRRWAVLTGRTTGIRYCCAESTYLPDRLPAAVCARLAETDHPIGRVLAGQGLRLDRQPMAPADPAGTVPPFVDGFSSQIVWSRIYRLLVDGQPAFVIREWFLQPVLSALRHPDPGP